MPPVWNPNEATPNLYEEIEHHSEGMISFTYRPAAQLEQEPPSKTSMLNQSRPITSHGLYLNSRISFSLAFAAESNL